MTDNKKTAAPRKRRSVSKVRLLKEVLKYLDEVDLDESQTIIKLVENLEQSIVEEAMRDA